MELAKEHFYDRFPCIIISAEGPPDFLYKLKMDLNLPVLALFDCDPYWFKMMSFYGHGLNDIKWLGIRPTDFDKYKMGERLTLPMTNKDIKIGKDFFKDHFVNQNPEWLLELKVMLECNRKTEIDALYCFGLKYLTRVFLPMKLQEEDWI
ncbi:DNA topoisomerase 6 subunit A [Orobanche minor]